SSSAPKSGRSLLFLLEGWASGGRCDPRPLRRADAAAGSHGTGLSCTAVAILVRSEERTQPAPVVTACAQRRPVAAGVRAAERTPLRLGYQPRTARELRSSSAPKRGRSLPFASSAWRRLMWRSSSAPKSGRSASTPLV